jgi:hypothetical protein
MPRIEHDCRTELYSTNLYQDHAVDGLEMRQWRDGMDSMWFPMYSTVQDHDVESECHVDRARQGVVQPNTKVQSTK